MATITTSQEPDNKLTIKKPQELSIAAFLFHPESPRGGGALESVCLNSPVQGLEWSHTALGADLHHCRV